MKRDWEYSNLVKTDKKYGSPNKYIKSVRNKGMRKGMSIMIPVCAGLAVAGYLYGKREDMLKNMEKSEGYTWNMGSQVGNER